MVHSFQTTERRFLMHSLIHPCIHFDITRIYKYSKNQGFLIHIEDVQFQIFNQSLV